MQVIKKEKQILIVDLELLDTERNSQLKRKIAFNSATKLSPQLPSLTCLIFYFINIDNNTFLCQLSHTLNIPNSSNMRLIRQMRSSYHPAGHSHPPALYM